MYWSYTSFVRFVSSYLTFKIFYLVIILVVLCLCCCMLAFSSCSKQGLLSSCGSRTSYCSGFLWSSGSRAWKLQQLLHVGSVVATYGLSCLMHDLGTLPQPGMKLTYPAFIGRFLNHWTTREIWYFIF